MLGPFLVGDLRPQAHHISPLDSKERLLSVDVFEGCLLKLMQ